MQESYRNRIGIAYYSKLGYTTEVLQDCYRNTIAARGYYRGITEHHNSVEAGAGARTSEYLKK